MELGVELLQCAVELKRALLGALPVCVFDDFNDNDSDGDDYGDDYANLDSGADAESSSAGGSGSGDGGDYSAVATATATTTTAVSMQRLSPALQPTLVLRVVEVEARCRVLGGLCHKSLATLPCDCRHAHRTHQAPPFFHALVLASRRVKPHASTVASLTAAAAAAADAAADTFGKDEGGGGSAEKEEEDGDGAALVVDAHWAAALGCFTDPKLRISTLAEYHNHNHNRGRGLGGGDVGRRRVHRLSESEALLSRGAAALKQSASVSLASASANSAASASASASGVRSADQESERIEGSSGSARWLGLLGEAEALCWLSLVSARLAVDHLEVEVVGSQVEDTLRAAVVLEVRALANLAQVESKRKAFPAALAAHRACLEVIRAAPAWIEGVLQDTRNNREAGCGGGRAKPLRIHPTDEAGTESPPTALAIAATTTANVARAVAPTGAVAAVSVSLVCLEQRVLDAATKAATNAGRPRDARRLCKAHLKLVQSEENVALLTKRLGSLEAAIANTAAAASKPGARLLLEPTSN